MYHVSNILKQSRIPHVLVLVLIALCGASLLVACKAPETAPTPHPTDAPVPDNGSHVSSPDGRIQVTFVLEDGVPYYAVSRSGKDVI
ncbi:MAG: hypothetical protein KAW49_03360, partial [Anaerolineae bacterium]|nr:hypothetical protein [Anaerolineae bacterium]